MRQRVWVFMAVLSLVALLGACSLNTTPDWQARYAERLGRPIVEMDESTIDQEYLDPATGALTRVAWVRLQGGETVFLGLPPHGIEADQVVERTVILSQQEWQNACAEGLGEQEIWGWEMNHAHPANSIRIYVNNQRDRYCEFFYLPQGWELRTVQSQGILKPFH